MVRKKKRVGLLLGVVHAIHSKYNKDSTMEAIGKSIMEIISRQVMVCPKKQRTNDKE